MQTFHMVKIVQITSIHTMFCRFLSNVGVSPLQQVGLVTIFVAPYTANKSLIQLLEFNIFTFSPPHIIYLEPYLTQSV